jgi:protein transport protein SEC61 subunit alpha
VYVQTPIVEIKPVGELTRLLVVLQLAIVVYLLDEVLDSYRMCPVFTLFMASNTCKSFLWLVFSPVTIDIGRGPEFEGSLLCLTHLLLSWRSKFQAVYESLLRQNQTNLVTLRSSLFVLVAIIYL